jgi:hypothetical protein
LNLPARAKVKIRPSSGKSQLLRSEAKMEKNKKKFIVLTTIILASFLFGSIVTAVGPEDSSFLEEVWNAIFGIEEEVEEISDDVLVLKSNLDLLERIHDLETRIALLENGGPNGEPQFPAPSYDSGWHKLTAGQDLILIHNLDTTEYFVYFIVTEDEPTDSDPFVPTSFHNFGTGGAFVEDYVIDRMYDLGTYWEATKNSIEIYRYPQDTVCNYARVILWKIP